MDMKKVLITGANFKNKGAQSMLFTATAEVLKINPKCEVYFATITNYDESTYTFKKIRYDLFARQFAMNQMNSYEAMVRNLKDTVKYIMGRKDRIIWGISDLKKLMQQLDLVVDVSGFSIGQKWPIINHEIYLDGIRLARKYSVPIILMPQSFGPFEYEEERQFLVEEMADLLTYPDIIFAREKDGYNALCNTFGLSNVRLSSDLVLQNGGFDISLVMTEKPVFSIPEVASKNAVAVIPNIQCFNHGTRQNVLKCYDIVIRELLYAGKEVYIFRHSREDLDACQDIYSIFKENIHVHILVNDFSCLEYDEFIKKFDFVICSRFHGIVHAYRNNIPAIILGWAVKYVELAESVSQEQYVFNIVDENVDYFKLGRVTQNMLQSYSENSCLIAKQVSKIQQNNCFECLKKYLCE